MPVDIAELRIEEGRRCLVVAIARTAKLTFAELGAKAACRDAGTFLRVAAAAAPDKIQDGAH